MRYLILGFITTFFFENQILKNYDIDNPEISTLGIILGWVLQNFIKETFNLTGGKFYITNSVIKNQIILKALYLMNDIINIVYLTTLIETILCLSLLYFLCIKETKYISRKNLKITKLLFCFIYLSNNFLDVLFLINPFIFIFFISFSFFVLLLNLYIIYLFLLKKLYLKIPLIILKTVAAKTVLYSLFLLLFLILSDTQLNFSCNNLPKEIYFKFLFLVFN